jgi:hypothetical protein
MEGKQMQDMATVAELLLLGARQCERCGDYFLGPGSDDDDFHWQSLHCNRCMQAHLTISRVSNSTWRAVSYEQCCDMIEEAGYDEYELPIWGDPELATAADTEAFIMSLLGYNRKGFDLRYFEYLDKQDAMALVYRDEYWQEEFYGK